MGITSVVMKIYMTAAAKQIIDKMETLDSERLFADLARYKEKDPETYKEPCRFLNPQSDLDIRVIVDHPFINLDLPMTEHIAESGANKRMMAFFKAEKDRNQNIEEALFPLEID
jgi:hypothetical protein